MEEGIKLTKSELLAGIFGVVIGLIICFAIIRIGTDAQVDEECLRLKIEKYIQNPGDAYGTLTGFDSLSGLYGFYNGYRPISEYMLEGLIKRAINDCS